jgi:two-component system nitrate/nitrite sensor histidine kinase NarX
MNDKLSIGETDHCERVENDHLINRNDPEALLTKISNQQRDIETLKTQITQLQEEKSVKSSERDAWWKGFDKLLLVSETVNDTLFSEPVFQKIIDTLIELTGFPDLFLSFFDQQTKLFNIVAYRGLDEEFIKALRNTPIHPDDFIGLAAQKLEPVYTANYAMEPILGNGWPVLNGVNSFIAVPCLADGLAQGMLGLFSADIIDWNAEKIDWLMAVGRRFANILYRVRLSKQLRTIAALEERARLGREFHDNLAQVLSYLNIQSQLSQTMLATGKYDEVSKELKDIEEVTSRAYDDLHDSILDLRFFSSIDKGLSLSLKEYGQEFQRRYQIRVDLDDSKWNTHAISPEQEVQILRIAQEAMTNVRKHAHAEHIHLILQITGETAEIIIRDDGCGFDTTARSQIDYQKLGLKSMKERAECINANLKINSQIGAGAEIMIETSVLQAAKEVGYERNQNIIG